ATDPPGSAGMLVCVVPVAHRASRTKPNVYPASETVKPRPTLQPDDLLRRPESACLHSALSGAVIGWRIPSASCGRGTAFSRVRLLAPSGIDSGSLSRNHRPTQVQSHKEGP